MELCLDTTINTATMVEISSYDVGNGSHRKLGTYEYGGSDHLFCNFSGYLKLRFVARGGLFVTRGGATP